ncbi:MULTISPECIES: NAD(+) diphosphatase [Clostridium]|uniref:NAD(+) diphosphatase n=1 Tax=Clostridium TaxID=1485 RepID=UPI00215318BA|nr:NUDIX domain-containing protein [Clostridium sp. LY3-2]MCR6513788.1 NUDIX domain-containing protein [Clostridium sp. LY3-2]
MKHKYCTKCGRRLVDFNCWDEGIVPYCPDDDILYFDVPKPCIVVGIVKDDSILLLKQSYIYKNSKVLLSGYVDQNECAEDTVKREALEETGLVVDNVRYLGSDFVRDKDLFMITYMAEYVSGDLKKSSEVEGASWCKLKDALNQMSEDEIGKKAVKEILKLKNL